MFCHSYFFFVFYSNLRHYTLTLYKTMKQDFYTENSIIKFFTIRDESTPLD